MIMIEEGKSYVTNAGQVVRCARRAPGHPFSGASSTRYWILNSDDVTVHFYDNYGRLTGAKAGHKSMELAREYVEPETAAETFGTLADYVTVAQPSTIVYPDGNPKTIMGLAKPGTAAIPPIAILQLGQAMHNGEVKYGRFNWRDKTVTTSVYTDAIDRHMLAFRDGEDSAEDSGLSHLAHVMACCAILMDAAAVGKLNDDRRRDGPTAEFIKRNTKGLDAPVVSDK